MYASKTTVLTATAVFLIGGVGCATKKHVRQVVTPIETRVGEVEKTNQTQASSISELETNVSRVDERAIDAERKATAAGQSADRANQAATQAGEQATNARALAEKGLSRAEQIKQEMKQDVDQRFANIDNYQMVVNETVLFPFNRYALNKEAKEKLDDLAKNMNDMKHYVIEVQGFTDKSGAADYNLELSRKRANEVVRYLTINHSVPLRRIHVLGVGSESPAAEGRTREARKQNRRVEVKVFAVSDTTTNAPRLSSQANPSGSQ
jgi:outer membrane protein OmpA-like peptidoglycan-associated protein